MAHTFVEAFYHLVWSTRQREPMLVPELEPRLIAYLRQVCTNAGVEVLALNCTADHVHLACSIPPRMAVADLMEQLKGASSHFVNHLPEGRWALYWQPGYGCLTLTRRDLPRIVAYISNQKTHHADASLLGKLERVSADQPATAGLPDR